MHPLDLSKHPPRSPREKLAGLFFAARVVDKLRAALPGGEPNGYFPFTGFSELWQHYSGIKLRELYDVVAAAQDEAKVVAWLEARTATLDKDAINAKLERFDGSRVSDAFRETFESTYPPELRERHPVLFDLLEADDDRIFSRR
jgi:hypothetical protein